MLGYIMLGWVTACQVRLGQVMLGEDILSYVNKVRLRKVELGQVM